MLNTILLKQRGLYKLKKTNLFSVNTKKLFGDEIEKPEKRKKDFWLPYKELTMKFEDTYILC